MKADYFLSRRGIDVIIVERINVRHPGRPASSRRWTGAPAARSMRWRGEVSDVTPPCPTRLRAIGAILA
jgi:hypothetical protein